MHGPRYCTVALAAASAIAISAARAGAQPASTAPYPGDAMFVVFAGGREIGREQVSVSRTAAGWTIVSTSRLGAPLNLTGTRFEITYAPDWQPIELKIDALVQDKPIGLNTSFGTTTAINEITQAGVTNSKTDQITARTVVLPNNFFGAYEALVVRLASTAVGGEIPIYVVPQGEIRLLVKAMTPSTYQTPAGPIATRRYSVVFQNPAGPLAAEISIDGRNRFAALEIAGMGLTVTRQDLAGVAARHQTVRNPTDADVQIPASGFGLAGTLTTPPAQGKLKHPAIMLVAGAGPIERDSIVAGIPLFAQLAAQLADLGFVVLRYDKRGTGQSGGRTETATLNEYADDAIAGVKWLAKRKDVDNNRIVVAAHGEGAAVAMLAAAREGRIAGIALLGGLGTTGRELVLEQQEYMLTQSKVGEPERTTKIELQKQILDATISEKGWESVPPDVRRAVDTPMYRSLLTFDPAKVMPRVKQPILILHGELDRQIAIQHASRLEELAKARKKAPPVELKVFPGLNHLLVPAKSGDVAEYEALEPRTISLEIAKALAAWAAGVAR